jgi:hypothetical protein
MEIDNSTGLGPAMIALEEKMKERSILFEAIE